MATQQITAEQLYAVFDQTLSLQSDVRQNAEQQLVQAQKVSGHPLAVLQIVANANVPNPAVRQAAAVHFKNTIKQGWDNDNDPSNVHVSAQDRDTIKSHLVELMCTVPPSIRSQCSEAISLIAAVDFPDKWDALLPGLVQKFGSTDPAVVNGVLATANSIFKRFRLAAKSDQLYAVILYVLHGIQSPLLNLFLKIGQEIDAYANDASQLVPRFESLRLICRIFYSLNYHDLPEFFEDHIEEWMTGFARYLQYQNPLLVNDDDDDEPGPIDKLQAAIVANLDLYANKDEEPFLPYLSNFTTLIWNNLMTITDKPKHDIIATSSIRFLSSLVQKTMHRALFQEEATLSQIISKIVIPNLMLREVDEERFEDDPQEFIATDLEGNESESRRKRSQELLKAMCRQFETECTAICLTHIGTMLEEYKVDPANTWARKDVAVHLVLGISIRAESAFYGVSQVNDQVDIMSFLATHILPELREPNMTLRPLIKATALKFVCTFRNQFTVEQLKGLMPLLVLYLEAPSVVVHTYAAVAIEKILTGRDTLPSGGAVARFGPLELQPHLQTLFTSLFKIIDNETFNENSYVMKCVMRSLYVGQQDLMPIMKIVLEKLTASLARVAKNPRNPQYNHYIFESIAIIVRAVCSKDPGAIDSFEAALFPPFQTILQMDVSEFTPYVFQVLAQLLEYRPRGNGMGEAYRMLLGPLLTRDLWERKGNIPALTRLLKAYLGIAAAEIVKMGKLEDFLGTYQKLIASRANEAYGADLLTSLLVFVSPNDMQQYLKEVFRTILTRLQHSNTPKSRSLVSNVLALFVGKYGSQAYFTSLDAVQPGLGVVLLSQVWLPSITGSPPVRIEAKVQVVGLTRLISDSPVLLQDPNGQAVWVKCVAAAVSLLTSSGSILLDSNEGDGADEMEVTYDSAYSSLQFARKAAEDPFADVLDPALSFTQALHGACSAQPGRLETLIQEGLSSDPKLSAGLQSMLAKAGVTLM